MLPCSYDARSTATPRDEVGVAVLRAAIKPNGQALEMQRMTVIHMRTPSLDHGYTPSQFRIESAAEAAFQATPRARPGPRGGPDVRPAAAVEPT